MSLPQYILDVGSEELDSLQTNVIDLFNQYIKPIDAIRSKAWPINIRFDQNNSNQNSFQVSNTDIFESRAHALFRVLSFPVIGGNDFYNPGFISNNLDQVENKTKIRSAFFQNEELKNILQNREQQNLNSKNIFLNQDLKSSLWSLLLKYPPPMLLFSNTLPLQNDAQKITISDRTLELERLSEINKDSKENIISNSNNLNIVQKLLKPFVVDPRIEITVTPDLNQICAPFLPNKNSCQLQKNIFLNRCGLELIIRQRLSNVTDNKLFLEQTKNILKQKNVPGIDASTLSSFSVIDSMQALSEHNELDNSTKELLNNFSNYQFLIINQLTKYIKFCVKKLVDAIKIIDNTKFQINWFPIPSKDGPITGLVGAKLSSFGLKNNNFVSIEQKIYELKIKKLNAQRSRFDNTDIGNFLSPFDGNNNLENILDYEEQLSILEKKKNKISDIAFVALSEIEMLVGEIAGIGLIDVLSIYLALWSIDVNTLIHFLDQNAFNRMITYNPEFLSIQEVQNRNNSGAQLQITEVLQNFQNSLFNILSYSDKIFQSYLFSNI